MLTPPKPSSPRRRALGPALVMAGALALGACSSGTEDTSAGSAAPDTAAAAVADPALGEEATESGPAPGEPAAGGGVDLVAATDGRQIISTAHVELTVDDADRAAGRITDLVAGAGGFVSGEETSRVGGTRTTLVVRVPPQEFAAVLDELAELGELTAQRIETDEVTEQVVDLESRITTAEASVSRLRALLGRSGSIADIAQVEAELLARETTLETLRGQLRTIERQVALATITVRIEAEDAAPVVDEDEGRPSFLGGLMTGWNALLATLAGAAALVGVLVPWLVAVALVAGPAWRLLRSRRRSAPAEGAA